MPRCCNTNIVLQPCVAGGAERRIAAYTVVTVTSILLPGRMLIAAHAVPITAEPVRKRARLPGGSCACASHHESCSSSACTMHIMHACKPAGELTFSQIAT